jgi:hypothetical protein
MITILSDEENTHVGERLLQAFSAAGQPAELVPLQNTQVKPCVGCNGCTYRTYGKCVIRDDGDWIYPKIAQADALVTVSPIVFGGHSLRMKRVLDKFGLFMDRHYFLVHGELAKGGMPGRAFRFHPMGLADDCTAEETQAFSRLVHETVMITRGRGEARIASSAMSGEEIQAFVAEVAGA